MTKRPLIFLLASLVLAFPQPTRAEKGATRPVIADAQVYVVGTRVVTDIRVEDLFSERIAGTVQSGLPALVELLYRLFEGKSSVVHQGLVAYELRYDVWEDRYVVTDVDSMVFYPTFETMKDAMQNIRGVSWGDESPARAVAPLACQPIKRWSAYYLRAYASSNRSISSSPR